VQQLWFKARKEVPLFFKGLFAEKPEQPLANERADGHFGSFQYA